MNKITGYFYICFIIKMQDTMQTRRNVWPRLNPRKTQTIPPRHHSANLTVYNTTVIKIYFNADLFGLFQYQLINSLEISITYLINNLINYRHLQQSLYAKYKMLFNVLYARIAFLPRKCLKREKHM